MIVTLEADHRVTEAAFVANTFKIDPRRFLEADRKDQAIMVAAHNVIARRLK